MSRLASLFIVTMMVLVPFGTALAWTDEDDTRGPGPLADGTPWYDPLDDMTNVFTPTGGLVGVEVSGGNAHLKAGHDSGWIASSVIEAADGYRYDLVVLEVDTPGDSWVNVTVLDPSKASTDAAFANGTVPGFINLTGNDVSVFRVPVAIYPEVRIQVNMHANGTDRPRLLSWSLQFIELGLWMDDFLGTGKMIELDGLSISGGTVQVDLTSGQTGSHEPYPTVVFPDARSTIDVFYANSAGNGYDDSETIQLTASTRGMDVGDLDGDGLLDLILAMNGNVGSAILWGQPSGEWTHTDMFSLSHRDEGTDVAVGDFNGDDDLDFAISAIGGMVHDGSYVWLNKGDGTFNKAPDIKLDGGTRTLAAGDLNEDGYDDLVFAKSLVMDAPCYFGSANGPDNTADINFLRGISMAAISDVHIGDIDGDDHLDVLFAVHDSMKAPVYIGSASGPDTTSDYDLKLKGVPTGVSVGDINDDGHNDIAYSTYDATSGTNPRVEIFKGTDSGWSDTDYHEIWIQGTITGGVEVVDIDVDGYDDVAVGYQSDFKVYMGGKTWPTAASISKTGLMAPEDMAVAVAGGQGGTYSGHFVSEMIPIPDGMVWDVLYLDADIPDGMEVAITVLDSGQDPLTVYTELPGPAVDLSHIGPWRSIYVQVDVTSDNNTTSPTLRSLLVNWHPENVWRDQFFGDIKSESMLNLEERALRLMPSGATSTLPDLVFAGRRSDNLYDVKSLAFMDAGSMDYLSTPPLVFNTVGATAVDAYDINGDGIPDLAFSSYGTSPTNQVGESYVFLGSPSGWYDVPYHTFSTYAASDILMDDLNNDGYADVVIAQDQAAGPSAVSLLFWGSEDGWETDPDVEFDTRGSRAVEAADLDGDGLKDLVFAYHVEGNSTIFYQESVGFCGTVPSHKLSTSWAWDVACGDLDGDGNQDLVFANAFDGVTFSVNSKVFWGQNGRGFKAVPTYLPTMGARGVAIADVDNDMDLDVIFANSRNASSGYKSEAGVYINDGSGGLTTTSMHYVGTDGASAVAVVDLDGRGVMDLVVASRNNGTTYRIPSMGYVGQTGSWPWEPSILFPTTGAVDVLPVSLSSPERGGYLSEAITPNPNDDPGAYGTLRYVADMGPGQGGTISVLDADTGHLLAETQMVGGENEWDISTLVSYRDHPSIRVEVEVLDLVRNPGFDLDDLWLNWTERVPKAPLVVDISISDTTVYRDDSVMLTVTVYDEFDLPKDLTLVVEHQLEGQTDWRTFLLSGRSFEDGVWNVTIRPDRFVPLGSYTFRVNVTDSDDLYSGYVELGQTLEVLPNLAKAPTLLTATAYNGMVELEWRAPHDTGDLPLDGYRVLRGRTGNDLSGITTTDAFADEYQDTGLTNGVTYFYAVVAYNDLGDSPWSEVLNATPLGVPGVPLDLSVNPGDGNVTIAWSPPALDGGSPVTGYRVLRGVFDGPLEEIATLGTVSEYLDEGLVNGQEYFFTVLAINDLGDGPQAVALPVVPLGPPGAPTGLTVRTDVMLLTISWDAPVDTGGSVLTGFIIYRGTSEDSLEFLQAMPASASNYADADLIAGQTYHYAVAAETAAGEGPLSPPVSSTAMNVPDAPADLVVEAGDGEVTLNWILPFDGGSPIIGCTVRRESGGNVETFPLWDVTTYIDASVVNGQTYIYSVNARNDMGDGPYTGPEEVTPMAALTVPDRVTSLSAVAKGGKVTVSWSPPSDDGGSVLTGYIVYRGEDVDSLTEIAQVGLVTSYLDEDVEGGKTYLYTVKAVNAVGPGPWVNAVSAKVQKEEVDEDEFPMLLMLGIVLVLVAIFIGRVLRPRLMGD